MKKHFISPLFSAIRGVSSAYLRLLKFLPANRCLLNTVSIDRVYTFFSFFPLIYRISPMAQQVKNPSAIQETQEMQVQSLGWEDPLG